MSTNPFDFINDVTNLKNNLIRKADDPAKKAEEYNPWLTNNTLSYFPDTVLYANEMNKYYFLPNLVQYDYFYNTINKRKRIVKQSKQVISDDLKMVMKYFGYNHRRAQEAMQLLTVEQLTEIKTKLNVGG
jgi:hypothetical protein